MTKTILACAVAAILSACGGGGSSTPVTAPVTKITKLSFYGEPMQGNAAVSHFAVAHASAATDSAASAAAAVTVQSLTDALAAQGVTANVTAQVMDGTTLHNLIMGTDNGLPPTPDQFKTDPSEYLIANFVLDDMVTSPLDPAQAAAIAQFQSDLTIFIQRAHVSGKQTFIVAPIPTCDAPLQQTAEYGLSNAEIQAAATAFAFGSGNLPSSITVVNGIQINSFTDGHMGADCRTPDAYLQNARVQAVAADIANRLKLSADGK